MARRLAVEERMMARILIAGALAALLLVGFAAQAAPAHAQSIVRQVVVNGQVLDARTRHALEASYRTRLHAGQYWYDRASGLWGRVGGPSQGQITPGLQLGRLDARASVGAYAGVTGVYVNGREIHPAELSRLRMLFGSVRRARYWLDASGVAGYEGGPAQFDLRAAAVTQRRGSGYIRRGPGGATGSDGSCSYYNDPSTGASVMTGSC
jgi:hypothetical protein